MVKNILIIEIVLLIFFTVYLRYVKWKEDRLKESLEDLQIYYAERKLRNGVIKSGEKKERQGKR